MAQREIASIVNCLFCNAQFVVVISAISINEGEGMNMMLLQEKLEGICKKVAEHPFDQVRCPSCTESITGMSFAEWLYSDVSPVFTLCVFENFNSPAALYVNTSNDVLLPRWQLILGNGPKELYLKDDQSGLLHQNTYTNWGVPYDPTPFNPVHRAHKERLYIIDTVHQAVRSGDARQLVSQLHQHRPLFQHWERIANCVEDLALDLSSMKI